MKTMKNIVLGMTFILLALLIQGQEKAYDAVYNKITKEYVLNEDGSYDYHEVKELTLNTHFAFHRLFGETFIIYNPEYQQLEINESYTTMADGTVVPTPENAFNELLPRFADQAPAYNHLREMAITHTGLEVGATIHLDYTIRTDAGMLPFFMGKEAIKENVPVDQLHVVVKVPKEESLRYRVLNIRTAPDIFEENGKMIYRWTFRSLSPRPADQYAYEQNDPVVFFSTAHDMQWAMFKFVDQEAFRSPLPASLIEKAAACRKKNEGDLALILKIQEMVLDGLNTKDIPLEYIGFRLRTPAEIWQSGWAMPAEKALLMSELYIAAGINAEPVAAINRDWFDRGYGNLFMFEDFFVQVNPKKLGRIYLSVNRQTDQNLLWAMDEYTLVQLDGAVETMRTFDEKGEQAKLALAGRMQVVDSMKMTGEIEATLSYSENPWFTLSRDSTYAHKILGNADKIKQYDIEKLTGKESIITFKVVAGADTAANYGFLELPVFRSGIDSWHLGTTDWQRRSPLKLPYPVSEIYKLEIELPEGLSYVGEEVDIRIQNDTGTCSVTIKQKEGTLDILRELIIDKELYQINEIRQFRELIEAWNSSEGRKIVLKWN